MSQTSEDAKQWEELHELAARVSALTESLNKAIEQNEQMHVILNAKLAELEPLMDHMKSLKAAGRVGAWLGRAAWKMIGFLAAIASIVAAWYAHKSG